MSTTPTQRTLAALKAQGLKVWVVEKWNAHARRPDGGRGVRQDMFGIIDIIALDPQRGVIGVQSTGTDFAGHVRKLTEEKAKECIWWLCTPGAVLELWGWRRVKIKRGGKQMVYRPRIREFTLEDFITENPLTEDSKHATNRHTQ